MKAWKVPAAEQGWVGTFNNLKMKLISSTDTQKFPSNDLEASPKQRERTKRVIINELTVDLMDRLNLIASDIS